MPIHPFQGARPRIHRSAWIAPNATIIGDVEIGPDSSVFHGCVLRGDVGPIRIGSRCNIQDNSVIHVEREAPCILEDDVTVGHMAMLHGTHVGAGSLVGMSAPCYLAPPSGPVRSSPPARWCARARKSRPVPWPPASRPPCVASFPPSNPRRLSRTPRATWTLHNSSLPLSSRLMMSTLTSASL